TVSSVFANGIADPAMPPAPVARSTQIAMPALSLAPPPMTMDQIDAAIDGINANTILASAGFTPPPDDYGAAEALRQGQDPADVQTHVEEGDRFLTDTAHTTDPNSGVWFTNDGNGSEIMIVDGKREAPDTPVTDVVDWVWHKEQQLGGLIQQGSGWAWNKAHELGRATGTDGLVTRLQHGADATSDAIQDVGRFQYRLDRDIASIPDGLLNLTEIAVQSPTAAAQMVLTPFAKFFDNYMLNATVGSDAKALGGWYDDQVTQFKTAVSTGALPEYFADKTFSIGTTVAAFIPGAEEFSAASAVGDLRFATEATDFTVNAADRLDPVLSSSRASGSGLSVENLSRDTIIDGLSGVTNQSGRIAEAIANRDIGLNVLGDGLFEKAYTRLGGTGDAPTAFAYGEQTYVRASSTSILSDVVHEGTHALDYLDKFEAGDVYESEMRAYSAEYDFQKTLGVPTDFSSRAAINKFIRENY
ncbi:MAG TPA: hypothetical protein VG387_03080, partial [Rhizomicrobium sp.]|nr:hypothetical protein [Rhizomicrobium sp.]